MAVALTGWGRAHRVWPSKIIRSIPEASEVTRQWRTLNTSKCSTKVSRSGIPPKRERLGWVGSTAQGVYCETFTSEQLLLSKLASPSQESLMPTKYFPGERPPGSKKDTSLLLPEPLTMLAAEVVAEEGPWQSVANSTTTFAGLIL